MDGPTAFSAHLILSETHPNRTSSNFATQPEPNDFLADVVRLVYEAHDLVVEVAEELRHHGQRPIIPTARYSRTK